MRQGLLQEVIGIMQRPDVSVGKCLQGLDFIERAFSRGTPTSTRAQRPRTHVS